VGRINAIDADAMTISVRETTIQVVDDTVIKNRRGEDISFTDLVVGKMVDARGELNADGVLVAALIRVQEENQGPGPVRPFVGPITALNLMESITVRGRVVNLTRSTEFVGFGGAALDPAALLVGDLVMVIPERPASPEDQPTSRTITAKTVKLHAAVLEAVDADLRQITVLGGPVQITDETIIKDVPDGDIAFEDLMVGDLVKVILSDAEVFPPMAVAVIRVSVPDFSDPIGNFDPTRPGRSEGSPAITSTSADNCFGFVSLPTDMIVADPEKLYNISMVVKTDNVDPATVPVVRVRANMANYEKGATLVANATGSFSQIPTPEGRLYNLLFVPPADINVDNADDAAFFVSLDLLSFESRFASGTTFTLDSVNVAEVAVDDIEVVDTLVHDEFISGTNGWTFSAVPEAFSAARHGNESGALSLAPVDHSTFGFWTKDTGVIAEPGKTYRARFFVYTNVDDPAVVPTFRTRLNASAYELGAIVNVDAVATLSETLRTDARVYDVYLTIPANASGTETILASIDLVGFDARSSTDASIILEQFYLEEINLNP
jgi:hypothetical protein